MCELLAFFVLIYVISISIFIGHVGHTTAVHPPYNATVGTHGVGTDQRMQIGNAFRHLLVFLQVSDLHLSKFQDPERISAFREFCSVTVDTLKPDVVIASGDLTDAKYEDAVRTKQFEEEWIHYHKALESNKVLSKTLWLDLRGNHDNFNVHNWSDSLYSKYAVQAQHYNKSYMYTVVPISEKRSSTPSERYSFIAVDAVLSPGPKAPWNFYGKIENEEFELLKQFESDSRNSDGVIWFGHYPTSFIVTPRDQPHIRQLMSKAAAYLCGHLHTAYGMVEKMYTIHHSQLLELELADFKINRRVRVGAFDHGVFAFTDVEHNKWPVVLVTNPKNVLFNNPKDLDAARKSTHIRLLVFSVSKIVSVSVQIDSQEWVSCTHIQGSLYVINWDPKIYFHGIHHMNVNAVDKDGNELQVTQNFAFDDSTMSFSFLGRVALMIDAVFLPYALYLSASILAAFPWVVLRILHKQVTNKRMSLKQITKNLGTCGTAILRKLWITATINKLYYPLVLAPLYWPTGPWYVGEVLDGCQGIAFAWGTIVDNLVLPAAFGYMFDGCVQLVWFHVPFILVLSHCVDRRFRMICWKENLSTFWNSVPLFILVIFQVIVAKVVFYKTGLPILFLGELNKFSIIYGTLLWFFSATLQKHHFQSAEMVWKNPPRGSETRRFLNLDDSSLNAVDNDDHDM